MKTLKVALLQNSYNIYINSWNLNHSINQLKKFLQEDKIYIITNTTVKKLYQKKINKAFPKHIKTIWISIPDGERYKNLSTIEKIHTRLSQKNANRKSALLALGGGVVGDIAGFVASTYMRGIKYFQMPTTLLSQVDSAVGGKTGVDLKTGKNLVGAFYQPKAVFIHTDFLKTLPKREIKCGLAEVIKYGIIWDKAFFDYLGRNSKQIKQLNPTALGKIIYRSCEIKAQVVKRDEKENSFRAILNYGHTLGHAIEALTGFKKIQHGEAVAMGMVFAADLSYLSGHSKVNYSGQISTMLKMFGLPHRYPIYSSSAYKQAILRDKKASGKIIKFILIQKIGKVSVIPLDIKNIVKWLYASISGSII